MADAHWEAPEEMRAPLLAARERLTECERAFDAVLVEAFTRLVAGAKPAEKHPLVSLYAETLRGRGEAAAADHLLSAWAACERAYEAVYDAEEAMRRGLPAAIDLPTAGPPTPEESSP